MQVYVPGQALAEGEELEVDNSTYEMLHRLTVEWPILSFDFVRDSLGQQRTKVRASPPSDYHREQHGTE